jgi:uncharacterized protein (TIGR02646 family)
MKFVSKGGSPHEYRGWCRSVVGSSKERYDEVPGPIKAIVLDALSKDQGDICAYTMRRIGRTTSHVEHVKPESICVQDRVGSDLDFSNMVACFPRDGMPRKWRYGAQKKANWWVPARFVSPLDPSCEKRFHFNLDGEVSAVRVNDAALSTIHVLGLDNETLTEDRRRAIQEFIYGEDGRNPLSKAKASRLRSEVCSKSDGKYAEFCVAIRDALDDYLKYVEKLARKKKFAKSAKR